MLIDEMNRNIDIRDSRLRKELNERCEITITGLLDDCYTLMPPKDWPTLQPQEETSM